MHAWMEGCMYVCMYLNYGCNYVCICVCMYVCDRVHLKYSIVHWIGLGALSFNMYVCSFLDGLNCWFISFFATCLVSWFLWLLLSWFSLFPYIYIQIIYTHTFLGTHGVNDEAQCVRESPVPSCVDCRICLDCDSGLHGDWSLAFVARTSIICSSQLLLRSLFVLALGRQLLRWFCRSR